MITKPHLVPVSDTKKTALHTVPAELPIVATTTTSHAVDTLARTLWGEARGEGKRGMEAVAAVIMNRVAVARNHGGRYWWGHDVTSVCRRSWQFSCWNEGDPNLPQLLAVTDRDRVFAEALTIARLAVNGILRDPTAGTDGRGATHYHARGITPNWAVGQRPVADIGRHLFFRLVD